MCSLNDYLIQANMLKILRKSMNLKKKLRKLEINMEPKWINWKNPNLIHIGTMLCRKW